MHECLITSQSEKKYIWNWSKILCIFHFLINLFIKTIIKSIIYIIDCAFEAFTYRMHIVKIVCQVSLPLFLTWVSPGNISYLDQCQIESVQLNIIVTGRRGNSLVYVDWWQLMSYMWMLHMLNICIEINLWKKPINIVIGRKLFLVLL